MALGHLHLAQRVAKKEQVRYSGSPLPLSMSERGYNHQVVMVELDGAEVTGIESVSVPRAVDMLKVPSSPGPLEQVLEELKALDVDERLGSSNHFWKCISS